jgi:hypothetical protein
MHASRLAAWLLFALASAVARADATTSDDRFSSRVQQTFASTTLGPRNTVYADCQAFRESKTAVPLRTQVICRVDSARTRTPAALQDRRAAR